MLGTLYKVVICLGTAVVYVGLVMRPAYLIGAANFDLKTEGGMNPIQHVPVLEYLPADLIIRADFLLHKEY